MRLRPSRAETGAEAVTLPELAEARQEGEARIKEIKEEGEETRARVVPREGQDTPLTPPNPVVNAITFMGTRLGTAWLPTPARGRTDAPRGHEVPASLREEERKKIIRNSNTTSCFQALIQ